MPVVDHGELQLQRVRDHDRALGAALVRCYHDAVAPAAHMLFDPRAKQRLHLHTSADKVKPLFMVKL